MGFTTGTGSEVVQNLSPFWWPEKRLGTEPRVGTHITLECPLCGPRGARIKLALFNPVDGKPAVENPTHWYSGNPDSWGSISLSDRFTCPGGGHVLFLQQGIVRLRRPNE